MTRSPRTAVLPFVLLTALDLVAVATLARCFRGPGELAYALPVCLTAQLVTGGLRRLGLRRREPRRGAAIGGALVALLIVFYVPLAALEAKHLSVGLPLSPAWHAMRIQFAEAWRVFSYRVAPVAEVPGLVLVTTWAAGLVGVAAEVLYADVGLPAVVALVPSFDVLVFVGALGTRSGRGIELAATTALAILFLATAQADGVPTSRLLARRDSAKPARVRSFAARSARLPVLAVAGALAAGIVGPVLPGATSRPLVAWHSDRAGGGEGTRPGQGKSPVLVSDLVQAAEEEVDDPRTLLLRVHSPEPLNQILFTLERFNGEAWSEGPAGKGQPLPGATGPNALRLPPPVVLRDGSEVVTQVVKDVRLAGDAVPTPGRTVAVGDLIARSTRDGVVTSHGLREGRSFAVTAVVPPAGGSALARAHTAAAPSLDLALPGGVPPRITALARRIVAGARDPYAKATAIEDYFLSGHGFVYRLPAHAPKGTSADTAPDYKALSAFLFTTRSGYCQQYATASAVLGRLVGLPTRVAVGFLPGRKAGKDLYDVTGSDVHAWMQVDFAGFGWVSFDATPARSARGSGPTHTTTSSPPTTVPPTSFPRQHRPGPTGTTLPSGAGGTHGHGNTSRSGGNAVPPILLSLLLAFAFAVAGVPFARSLRWKRLARDPRRAPAAGWSAAAAALSAAGLHRRRAETRAEFVARVERAQVLSPEAEAALSRLRRDLDRSVYGAPGTFARDGGESALEDGLLVRRFVLRRLAFLRQVAVVFDPRENLQGLRQVL